MFKNKRPCLHARFEMLENRRLFSLGSYDPTFGSGGIVKDIQPATTDSVVALPNGDTVTAGTVPDAVYPSDVYLRRYTPGGAVDTSFGNKGTVSVATNGYVDGLAEDTLGRLIVAVENASGSTNATYSAAIYRFTSNGVLDSSFGKAGALRITTPGQNQLLMSVDDKSRVVVQLGTQSALQSESYELARFTAQGSPDLTFGKDGIATVTDPGTAICEQPDGKVLLGVNISSQTLSYQPAVVRYNANGTLDTSFGSHGIALSTVPIKINFIAGTDTLLMDSEATTSAITVLANGDVAITGNKSDIGGGVHGQPPLQRLYVAELNSKGMPVNSFGTKGAVVTVVDPTTTDGDKQISPVSIAAQGDGSLVVAGSYFPQYGMFSSSSGDALIARYTSAGIPDLTFGDNGVEVLPLPIAANPQGISSAFFAAGKITIAVNNYNQNEFDLLRYDVAATGSASGIVFNDLNGNGSQQKNEPGLPNAIVYVDVTDVGHYVFGDPLAASDSNGRFTITGLDAGTYTIRVKPTRGWYQTFPANNAALQIEVGENVMISSLLFGEHN